MALFSKKLIHLKIKGNKVLSLLDINSNLKRLSLPQLTNYKVCNPSIALKGNSLLVTYKGVSFDLREEGYCYKSGVLQMPCADTQNYYAEVSSNFEIKKNIFIEDRYIRSHPNAYNAITDLRIFKWRGKWCVLGAAVTHIIDEETQLPIRKTTMALCELVDQRLRLICFLPSRQLHEKNWMPWVVDNELFLIYSSHPFEILKFDGEQLIPFKIEEGLNLEDQRGGSCVIPYQDKFIAVVHKKIFVEDNGSGAAIKNFFYTHSVVVYDKGFNAIGASPEFTFESESVEFCAGLAITNRDIILSYGIWDSEAVLLKLPIRDFFDALNLSGVISPKRSKLFNYWQS